jgi:hypothetical protein
MTDLAFLSLSAAPATSALTRALAGATGIRDVSHLGKLEVRGGRAPDGVEAIRITADRTLLVCDPERVAEVREAAGGFVLDLTGALAGIEVAGEQLLRRLTDLDLDALPASGKVAGVAAVLTRDGDTFRILFAQEYGRSVVELVRDVQAGLA